LNLLQTGGDPDSEFAATRACDISQIDFSDSELKSEAVGGVASRISTYPSVRAALLERQRAFANQPGGAVLDGRDIGTVIAPDASVKLFIVAAAEKRAERRMTELGQRGMKASFKDVLIDIRSRDERDSARGAAPLKQAPDALLLDTTELTVEQAAEAAIRLAEDHLGQQ